MKKFVDVLLDAMVNHDPDRLPLADRYKGYENYRPSALNMMESFRTITGVNEISTIYQDKVQNSVFFYANVSEGGKTGTLLYTRLVIEGDKINELEINLLRSRGGAGFIYLPEETGTPQPGWTAPIPEGQKLSREELVNIASQIYTGNFEFSYPCADGVYLMENGGIVRENTNYAETMWGDISSLPSLGEGFVPVLGGAMPLMSKSPAKVFLVDEEQGVFGVWAVIDGFASPYIQHENSSCFVPTEVIDGHRNTITKEKLAGKSVMVEMPASCMTLELYRIFDNKIQGQHRFTQLQAIGGRFPW